MDVSKSRKFCCNFFVRMAKSVPVIFILCILSWSYYAYVFQLCFSTCVRDVSPSATRRWPVDLVFLFIYLFIYIFSIILSRSYHDTRSQSTVFARIPRHTDFLPVVLLQDYIHRAGRRASQSKNVIRLCCNYFVLIPSVDVRFFSTVQTARGSI